MLGTLYQRLAEMSSIIFNTMPLDLCQVPQCSTATTPRPPEVRWGRCAPELGKLLTLQFLAQLVNVHLYTHLVHTNAVSEILT